MAALDDTVSKLKNEKMVLVQEKEAAKLSLMEKSSGAVHNKANDRDGDMEMKKKIENYEERQNVMNRVNRKLEEKVNELENRLFKMEE